MSWLDEVSPMLGLGTVEAAEEERVWATGALPALRGENMLWGEGQRGGKSIVTSRTKAGASG